MTTEPFSYEATPDTTQDQPPVDDWAKDYDIFSKEYITSPFPIWDELREKCPVAHTDRWGGSFMPTRYEDLFAIAQDIEHFSSRDVLVASLEARPEEITEDMQKLEEQVSFGAPPITSDPPIHTWARKLLLPMFSIKAVSKYEEETRELCRSLIDDFINEGRADVAVGYAQQIPPRIIASMLGIPGDRAGEFTEWVRGFLELGLTNTAMRGDSAVKIFSFLAEQIQDRKVNPKDDLITYMLNAKVEGAPDPIPEGHVLGTCFLILVAGIDTTWSSIGSAMWHLAQNPQHRKHIIENPDGIQTAVEELLRAYSPVTMARAVNGPYEYKGCPMSTDDKVLMNFPAANRDPAKFEKPDEVILDRPNNPHIAFGVGIHRCAGSNLARMEMRVAIEEFLARIPDFELEEPDAVTWAGGQVRGPRSAYVTFPAGGGKGN